MREMTEVPKPEGEKEERRGHLIYTTQLSKEEESPLSATAVALGIVLVRSESWGCSASKVRVC